MKKATEGEQNEGKGEAVKAFVREEMEIIRKIGSDGEPHYFHPMGEEEITFTENLFDALQTPWNRLEALVQMMDDDDYDRIGFLLKGVLESAERLYEEVFHFVEEAIDGTIEVDRMGHSGGIYRADRVLGARIKKASQVKEG
jgi:hypothetical protein